jgi:hypothetical protein
MKTGTLIAKVRRGMSLPKVENRFSDAALLDLANDELQSSILPWLFSLREDYLIASESYSLASLAEGSLSFPIYASGRTLKDIWVSKDGTAWKPLQRIGLDEAWRFNENEVDEPKSFALYGDKIYFYPKPSPSTPGSLRLYYHILPNTLVSESRSVAITSLTGDDSVTVASTPSFFSSGSSLDIILQNPDFQVFLRDQEIASTTSTTITFSGYGPTNPLSAAGFAVGQNLCLAGETADTPLPTEVNQLLVQAVIVRVLESMNAPQQLTLALERFARLKTQLRDILTPRSENRLLKLRPTYPFLRSARYP